VRGSSQADPGRALAYVNGGGAALFSRRDLGYRQFADLCSEISLELNADDAVLDGEIVKLNERRWRSGRRSRTRNTARRATVTSSSKGLTAQDQGRAVAKNPAVFVPRALC
jgi:ATP-dependent DNA ligase